MIGPLDVPTWDSKMEIPPEMKEDHMRTFRWIDACAVVIAFLMLRRHSAPRPIGSMGHRIDDVGIVGVDDVRAAVAVAGEVDLTDALDRNSIHEL